MNVAFCTWLRDHAAVRVNPNIGMCALSEVQIINIGRANGARLSSVIPEESPRVPGTNPRRSPTASGIDPRSSTDSWGISLSKSFRFGDHEKIEALLARRVVAQSRQQCGCVGNPVLVVACAWNRVGIACLLIQHSCRFASVT